MRIGFDAKRAFRNFTGLGNYSRFVMDLVMRSHPEHTYFAYSPKRPGGRAVAFADSLPQLEKVYPSGIWNRLGSIWRTRKITSLLEKDGIDLFWGLSNELPLNIGKCRARKVVTMHDLIYIRIPSNYKPVDRLLYDYKYKRSCRNADLIIAVSECTKRDVVSCYGIPEEKVRVVYQGCDSSFRQPADTGRMQQVRMKYNLPERFILNVGTIEERKNALLAAKALLQLPADVSLVLVGRHKPYADKIQGFASANGLSDRIIEINNVDFQDLPSIYRLASVFVYPSRYEGFGIPILESLCSETPVIAATGSCLEEAGGPASVYIDPNDFNALAHEVNRLLENPDECARMATAGLEYSQRFTDSSISAELDKVLFTSSLQ